MKKILIILATVLLILALFVLSNGFCGIMKEDSGKIISVKQGMSGGQIAEELYSEGIITSKTVFKVMLVVSDEAKNIKAGTFEVSPKMSYSQIIETLTGYSTAGHIKITVVEGSRLLDVAKLFSEVVSEEEFLEEAKNGQFQYDFLKDIPRDENYLEGFLFPDTYYVEKDVSANVIINMMLKRFNEVYTEELAKQAAEKGFSVREIITLASIIEKEGTSDLEIISSVFHNRLDIGMRLESCATVNYLFEIPKAVLSIEDTHIDSPYNTYRNSGLPPAPICSPGEKAIKAAIYPEETNYLYFIADGQGGNLFSETFAQHLEKKGGR